MRGDGREVMWGVMQVPSRHLFTSPDFLHIDAWLSHVFTKGGGLYGRYISSTSLLNF